MKTPRQQSFALQSDEFKDYWKESGRKTHGGIYSIGKRKSKRPFSSKKPIHLVMRSSLAKRNLSMANPLNKNKVNKIVYFYAKSNHVTIHDYSNNGNHLHLSVSAPSRKLFQKYLRIISGLIARSILVAKKNSPKGKFWDSLAFTRVADWGMAFGRLKAYIFRNTLEHAGIIPYDRTNWKFIRIDSTS